MAPHSTDFVRAGQPDPRDAPTREWIEAMRTRYPCERYVDKALVRKLEIRTSPPYRPLTLAEAEKQLRAFLSATVEGAFELSDLRPLGGGASKEQFAFWLEWQDGGVARHERLVLRMQPAQAVVETHRLREFQILEAVGREIPVPKPYWLDTEPRFFQQPALIYSFVSGVARPPEGDVRYSARGGLGPKWRAILAPQFIQWSARIATFDYSGCDLSAFDIAAEGTNEAVLQVLNMWERAWDEDRLEAVPLVSLAAQWLRDNAPPVDRVSIVHGDYRVGNFLFDPQDGHFTAIMDWELVHFGDRHEDLATILLPALGERDENGDFLVNGLCSREEYLARYEAASGLPVDPKRLRYYEIYNYFRTTCMNLGSSARCMATQKSNQDIVQVFGTAVASVMLANLETALSAEL
ncbi:MAG: phosphotransferase family protein [Steroidobacteraceae bacterium]